MSDIEIAVTAMELAADALDAAKQHRIKAARDARRPYLTSTYRDTHEAALLAEHTAKTNLASARANLQAAKRAAKVVAISQSDRDAATATKRRANAAKQARYRDRHLRCEAPTKTRLGIVMDPFTADALALISTRWGVSATQVISHLVRGNVDADLPTALQTAAPETPSASVVATAPELMATDKARRQRRAAKARAAYARCKVRWDAARAARWAAGAADRAARDAANTEAQRSRDTRKVNEAAAQTTAKRAARRAIYLAT
jgi:hypothetical protein